MHISSLQTVNFRNIPNRSLNFGHPITAITGLNGVGKTNVLEAIYFLCLTKTASHSQELNNALFGQNWFTVKGIFNQNDAELQVFGRWHEKEKKLFTVNGISHKRMSDHIGSFPVVLVLPEDQYLITGGAEGRRKFLDFVLSQTDKSYLIALQQYQKCLDQRNGYLKLCSQSGSKADYKLLATYDEQLQPHAMQLTYARKTAIAEMQPLFETVYRDISNNQETPSLIYEAGWDTLLPWIEVQTFNKTRDEAAGRTLSGPHKDDLLLTLNQLPAKQFASQGQQKSLILALKLMQHAYLKLKTGISPLLLLDDIFEKLDANRLNALLHYVNKQDFGQTILTHTDKDAVKSLLSGKTFENITLG